VGLSLEVAEKQFRDDDLWLLSPTQRFVFEGAEDVRQWHEARAFVMALTDGFTMHGAAVVNEATVQLLLDLEERAGEALRRARERAKENRRGVTCLRIERTGVSLGGASAIL
jgi:hypothetical protein